MGRSVGAGGGVDGRRPGRPPPRQTQAGPGRAARCGKKHDRNSCTLDAVTWHVVGRGQHKRLEAQHNSVPLRQGGALACTAGTACKGAAVGKPPAHSQAAGMRRAR